MSKGDVGSSSRYRSTVTGMTERSTSDVWHTSDSAGDRNKVNVSLDWHGESRMAALRKRSLSRWIRSDEAHRLINTVVVATAIFFLVCAAFDVYTSRGTRYTYDAVAPLHLLNVTAPLPTVTELTASECEAFSLRRDSAYLVPVSTAAAPEEFNDVVYTGGESLYRHYRTIVTTLDESALGDESHSAYSAAALMVNNAADFAVESIALDGMAYVTSSNGTVLTPFSARCPRFLHLPTNQREGLTHRSNNIQRAYTLAFRYNLTVVFGPLRTRNSQEHNDHAEYTDADDLLTYGLGELNELQWTAMMEWSKRFPQQLNLSRLIKEISFDDWFKGTGQGDCYISVNAKRETWLPADYPDWSKLHNQRKVVLGWKRHWQSNHDWMNEHVEQIVPRNSTYRQIISVTSPPAVVAIGLHIRGRDRAQRIPFFMQTTRALAAAFNAANIPFHIFAATDDRVHIAPLIAFLEEISRSMSANIYTLLARDVDPLKLVLFFARLHIIVASTGTSYSALLTTGVQQPLHRLIIGHAGEHPVFYYFIQSIIDESFHTETLEDFNDQTKMNRYTQWHIDAMKHFISNTTSFPNPFASLLTEKCQYQNDAT